ncbi:M16 family metallopeptidase [Aliikangiella sp. IMCC44359]|uniref:M16 family metallopeptidase n=1 Tax=Aliikangiella sp. IMCC44359 TaxID=3459125 RepID=UPI00403AE642
MRYFKTAFAISSLAFILVGCGDKPETTSETVNNKNDKQVVEKKQKESSRLAIEKYQLANGLDVVLHQDKSDPVVAVAIVYHVGSNREKLGKTGFAHFFEHMLFQNSENVGAGNFIKNIGSMGGTLNGGTWQDGTIYYEVVPSDGLEKILWMESDRMGYFINTVTQEGLENEKQVVKNEKRQSVDNRPYGHTDYVTLTSLYPKGHPYSWDVIGSLEDLQNATLEDVREFYQQWYGINNATLVLAGDFETAQAKNWIKKYFGEFKPQPEVEPLKPMPVKLAESKSLYHEDNFAQLPELTMTFPTVEQYRQEAYALELLADLLSDGKDSIFYKKLVEEHKVAPSFSVQSQSSEIAGVFEIQVRAFDGIKLDKVKVSIDEAIKSFAENGYKDEQLARIMTSRETAFYNNLSSVFNKASTLAQLNEFAGDPNLITTEIERYRSVTREQIMAVFNQYINGKNYVATSFVPKGKVELILTGAQKANVVEEKIIQGAEQQMTEKSAAKKLEPIPQVKSSFDRSKNPDYGQAPQINLPDIWNSSFDNGLKVYGIEHSELPLVSFSVRVAGGHSLDQKGKEGVANLMTQMMLQGTAKKTPQAFEKALGELGAQLSFTAGDEFVTLTGSVLSKNFNKLMALVEEVILEPRWDTAEWQRIKQETLAQIQQANGNPGLIARNVFAKLLYGEESMLSTPVIGSETDVNSIELSDVKAFYNNNMVANLASFHVAGDAKQQQVMSSLNRLAKNWGQGEVDLPKPTPAKPIEKSQVYFVDIPGAKQSFIRIGNRAMVANSKDYYPLVAVNHNLGGSFSGHLFQILRLQKGYTYGAYSGVSRRNLGGLFTARSSVRSNVTLESLQTFREILSDYQKGFGESELASTQSVLAKANAGAFETTSDLMGVLQNISSYNLPNNYIAQQQEVLRNMTLEESNRVIKEYINPEKMIYLVVGDAKTQLPRMKELGFGEPILLDKSGDSAK